jgi:hypothetical protein
VQQRWRWRARSRTAAAAGPPVAAACAVSSPGECLSVCLSAVTQTPLAFSAVVFLTMLPEGLRWASNHGVAWKGLD